jgi:NitT/TauT family transport system substrate-binding protein
MKRRRILGLSAAALLAAGRPVRAEETLKLAIGQRGNWENSASELGQNAGFFRKRGLVLDILYTEGGGQTQQAVISGSVDIGVGVGTYGVLGAFAKGAPVRIIGNSTDGAHDLYWYVRADSPIHDMRDAAGKTVAFSTQGSSTNLVVLGLERTLGVTFQPVATGSPPATFTQVMSGQIDVGWASPPFGLDAIDQGRTRIVARGSDVPGFAGQSVRVLIANAAMLARRADAVARYMQAYRDTMDWLYSDPAALVAYGAWAGVSPERAKQVRDTFYPKSNLDPDRVIGLDALVTDAIVYKYLNAPLTAEQLKTLIQVPPRIAT